MKLNFQKYHGTGNDFILIDNRCKKVELNPEKIAQLCHRRFGIGADGLILLEKGTETEFKMVYFNSDGNLSSMCGNGGRCFVQFLYDLGLIKESVTFEAPDGLHSAQVKDDEIQLEMTFVEKIQHKNDFYFLDTGSPHHVIFCDNVDSIDVKKQGAEIRYSNHYAPQGTNVNFVEIKNETKLSVRTYERGVEDETYSCGTGAVATAIAFHFSKQTNQTKIQIETLGGILKIDFNSTENGYNSICLSGSATRVFDGIIEIL